MSRVCGQLCPGLNDLIYTMAQYKAVYRHRLCHAPACSTLVALGSLFRTHVYLCKLHFGSSHATFSGPHSRHFRNHVAIAFSVRWLLWKRDRCVESSEDMAVVGLSAEALPAGVKNGFYHHCVPPDPLSIT